MDQFDESPTLGFFCGNTDKTTALRYVDAGFVLGPARSTVYRSADSIAGDGWTGIYTRMGDQYGVKRWRDLTGPVPDRHAPLFPGLNYEIEQAR